MLSCCVRYPILLTCLLGFNLFSTSAFAACGYAEDVVTGAKAFSISPFGTLAIQRNNSFLILKPGNCISYNSSTRHVKFVVNHLSDFSSPTKAFLAVQVMFVQFSDKQSKTFLFRNQQTEGGWVKDKSKVPYTSLHDTLPDGFSKDLNSEQSEFDQKYKDASGRTWNDEIPTDVSDGKFSTWSSRRSFVANSQVIRGVNNNTFGARAQNYLISFVTRTAGSTATDKPLDFGVDLGGAQCVFVRTSGSDNVASGLDGEYILALNEDERCKALAQGFGYTNWFRALFSFFFR